MFRPTLLNRTQIRKPHGEIHASTQKLSFVEKAGYSAADAAANFVFMTMILFQTNFYTECSAFRAAPPAAIFLAAAVGRVRRSDRRRAGRPHQHALGQIPPVDSVHRRALVRRHGLAYTTPKRLEHGRD